MATVIRYVNTASVGGDGTTNGTAGATAAYASLAAWEAAERTNLVTDGDSHIVYCCGTSDTGIGTGTLDFVNWTTGASNTITIAANPSEADGLNTTNTFSTSHYYIDAGTDQFDQGPLIDVSSDYVTFEGIQFYRGDIDCNLRFFIYVDGNEEFNNCRFWKDCDSLYLDFAFLRGRAGAVKNCTFRNTGGNTNEQRAMSFSSGWAGNTDIINCVFDGFYDGIAEANAVTYTTNIVNCAFVNNTNLDIYHPSANGTVNIDYCATEDALGTNGQTITVVADTFTDATTGDYSIKDASSVLYSNGTSSYSNLTNDLRGTAYSLYSIGVYDGLETSFVPKITIIMQAKYMTFIELVNKVLIKLREDTVTTTTDNDYAALIGEYVNDTIREIEDSWDWNCLKSTIKLTCVPGTWNWTLTGANQRTRVLSVYDYTNKVQLGKITPEYFTHLMMTGNPVPQDKPTMYTWGQIDTDGVPTLEVYPIPDDTYELYAHVKIPRDIITDETVNVDLPPRPIILGSYAKALQERGEDQGMNLVHAQKTYELALGDAVQYDAAITGSQVDWRV